MTDDLVTRLRALDACAVSDAADQMRIETVALGLTRLSTDRAAVGRVVTVALVPAEEGRSSSRHLCTAAVEGSGPGDVIVVAHAGRETVSGWGGNLSLAASRRGIEGVIVDGACRDLRQTRDLDLPLFARGSVPVTARGRVVEENWGRPVRIAGITVCTGDLVIADADGVVFLPSEQAPALIEIGERIVAKEARMADEIASGKAISEVMGKDYEQMLEGR